MSDNINLSFQIDDGIVCLIRTTPLSVGQPIYCDCTVRSGNGRECLRVRRRLNRVVGGQVIASGSLTSGHKRT